MFSVPNNCPPPSSQSHAVHCMLWQLLHLSLVGFHEPPSFFKPHYRDDDGMLVPMKAILWKFASILPKSVSLTHQLKTNSLPLKHQFKGSEAS